MEQGANETDSGKPKYSGGGGPIPLPLCPLQIPHGLGTDVAKGDDSRDGHADY
jgi:hypothetical protein